MEGPQRVGAIDISSLERIHWTALKLRRDEAERVVQAWAPADLVARSFDEAQTAGHRIGFAVNRYLAIADENHQAFRSLIATYGVRHWAHWNLLRPVLEASFYVLWVLAPSGGLDRRRRALRLEVADSIEQRKWVQSLRPAGLSSNAVNQALQRLAETERVYQAEAEQLHSEWQVSKPNLTDVLPKLVVPGTGEAFGAYLVCVWRRLSGFQHGMQYAVFMQAEQGQRMKILGGESVFISVDDDDFVNTCKLVNALHFAAVSRYIEWHTSPVLGLGTRE